MTHTVHRNGTNPFNNRPVTYVIADGAHLSWNDENLVVFGRGIYEHTSIDFGWQSDPETARERLAVTLDRVGMARLVAWTNTFPRDMGRYDLNLFLETH